MYYSRKKFHKTDWCDPVGMWTMLRTLRQYMVVTFCILMPCFVWKADVMAGKKNEVEKRLSHIQKEYPDGSFFKETVTVGRWTGGGCNALVMYATLKVFHNAYTPDGTSYQKIGRASTHNRKALQKLFRKAKIGDVVRFRKGKKDTHFALFLRTEKRGMLRSLQPEFPIILGRM